MIGALALALAALLLGLLWQLGRTRPRPATAVAGPADEPASSEPRAAAQPWVPRRPAAEETPPLAPIIDEVKLEKTEVCAGEENLITVKAHTPAHREDGFLHYFVGTTTGRSVPLRLGGPFDDPDMPPLQIRVFGRDNVATTVPLPHYTVKQCEVERALVIDAHQVPNAPYQMALVAKVVEHVRGKTPPRIVKYRWSFGENERPVETPLPVVSHRFAPKDPEALYTEHLVRCEAVAADGSTVVGRQALSVRNAEYDSLHYKNTLVLTVELTPRYPELDAQGRVVQRVRLHHFQPEAVHLEYANITAVTDQTADRPQPSANQPARELLGQTEVPPGDGLEATFVLDTKAQGDAVMIDYDFEGRMADGRRAIAHFSVMRPPPAPTPETGEPVTDPVFAQKIRRAQERLGKKVVNEEEIVDLERQGVFADLGPAQTGGK